MSNAEEAVPCRLCGTATPMVNTELCDPCWELEKRIHHQPELANKILLAMSDVHPARAFCESQEAYQLAYASAMLTDWDGGQETAPTPLYQSLAVMTFRIEELRKSVGLSESPNYQAKAMELLEPEGGIQ